MPNNMDDTKTKKSSVTILAVLTTITLLAWVFLEAYQRFNKIEITSVSEKTLKELNPVLEREALRELLERKHFSVEEIDTYKISGGVPAQEAPKSTDSTESSRESDESTQSADTLE